MEMVLDTTRLVGAASHGDRGAFGDPLETSIDDAYRLALGIPQSPADAQDAIQIASLWFRKIVVRAALDARRSARHHKETPITDGLLESRDGQRVDALDEFADLTEAFRSLAIDDRAPLHFATTSIYRYLTLRPPWEFALGRQSHDCTEP